MIVGYRNEDKGEDWASENERGKTRPWREHPAAPWLEAGRRQALRCQLQDLFSYASMIINSPSAERKQHRSNLGGLGHILSCFRAAVPPDCPPGGLAWDDDLAGDLNWASGSQICDSSQWGEQDLHQNVRSRHLQHLGPQWGWHRAHLPHHDFSYLWVFCLKGSHPAPQCSQTHFPKSCSARWWGGSTLCADLCDSAERT